MLLHLLIIISELHGRFRDLLRKVKWQIFDPDQFGSALENRSPYECSLVLSDVSRPRIVLEYIEDLLRSTAHKPFVLSNINADKILAQRGNVVESRPEQIDR